MLICFYSNGVFKLLYFSLNLLYYFSLRKYPFIISHKVNAFYHMMSCSYKDWYAHSNDEIKPAYGLLFVISSLEWAYRPASRVVCSIYRYFGRKNNSYSDREYSLQGFLLAIQCLLNPSPFKTFRKITGPANSIRETFMKSSCKCCLWSLQSGPLGAYSSR